MEAALSDPRQYPLSEELLVRETNHRWSNDLQLVIGLLALQGRRAHNAEVRRALTDAMERVSVVSRARIAMYTEKQQSLSAALTRVCEALLVQAEVRSISVHLHVEDEVTGLSQEQIIAFALAVNELATNSIKHAFEEAEGGLVRISISRPDARSVCVTVDDDGRPFAEVRGEDGGIGMGLSKRLMAAAGGLLIPPRPGTKLFELRIPVQ